MKTPLPSAFRSVLHDRPSHHQAIGEIWHAALAGWLVIAAVAAILGWIYHREARRWPR